MKNKKFILGMLVMVLVLGMAACGSGGGKVINSAEALKEYLDKQPANSPDKPIKILMNATNMMLKEIGSAIRDAGKYVELDLSRSEGLTEISGFDGCTGLTNITLPNSVTEIGSFAFRSTSLASISIPNSVTRIGNEAFNNCAKLTNITIPNSVTEIGRYSFSDCKSLTNITIPNSIIDIDDTAFLSVAYKSDLHIKYRAGGSGTYTRESIDKEWTKQ